MSAPHGCTDDKAVVEQFKEALRQRVGAERYRMWFTHGVSFTVEAGRARHAAGPSRPCEDNADSKGNIKDAGSTIRVDVNGQFALDRLQKNFAQEIRGAAAQAGSLGVRIVLAARPTSAAAGSLGKANSVGKGPAVEMGRSDAGRMQAGPAPTSGGGNLTDRGESESDDDGNCGTQPVPSSQRQDQRRDGRSTGRANASAAPLSELLKPNGRSVRSAAGKRHSKADRRVARQDEDGESDSDIGHGASQQVQKKAQKKASEEPGAADGSVARPPSSNTADAGNRTAPMTLQTFIAGPCNQLAVTAASIACQDPRSATPLFLVGPSGSGKTHLMTAVADQFRRRLRMRRVIHLSAEQFTNDFIRSVGSSGLPSFRRRFRDVDALLIEDVQFLAAKKATLREMLYTVETLASAGRPLVFSANQTPTEIQGLTKELGGRMAAGLVCPMQPLDPSTRQALLRRWIEQRCPIAWPEESLTEICELLGGDGRMISGLVNLVAMLQRMYRRMPSMSEIRQFGGEMLRSQSPVTTLSSIERAVCEAFELEERSLQTPVQTRSITEPRMLAMYLSRQLTSSAYSEIARHYGGRSHSTAIAARRKVETWLLSGKSIGRGRAAMSAQQAIERIESILRAG